MDSEIYPEVNLDEKEADILISLVKRIIRDEIAKSDAREIIPVPQSHYNAIVREFTNDLLAFTSSHDGASEIVEFWEESGLNTGMLRYVHKVKGNNGIALTAGLTFMSKDVMAKIDEVLQCRSIQEITNSDGDILRSSNDGDWSKWDELGLDDEHIYYVPDDLLAKLQEVARTLVKVGSL